MSRDLNVIQDRSTDTNWQTDTRHSMRQQDHTDQNSPNTLTPDHCNPQKGIAAHLQPIHPVCESYIGKPIGTRAVPQFTTGVAKPLTHTDRTTRNENITHQFEVHVDTMSQMSCSSNCTLRQTTHLVQCNRCRCPHQPTCVVLQSVGSTRFPTSNC